MSQKDHGSATEEFFSADFSGGPAYIFFWGGTSAPRYHAGGEEGGGVEAGGTACSEQCPVLLSAPSPSCSKMEH